MDSPQLHAAPGAESYERAVQYCSSTVAHCNNGNIPLCDKKLSHSDETESTRDARVAAGSAVWSELTDASMQHSG